MPQTNGHVHQVGAGEGNWKKLSADFETLLISGTCDPESFASKPLVTPIVTANSFIMPGVKSVKTGETDKKQYEYTRYSNPTRDALESCLAKLENAKYALTYGSGSAAISAVLEILQSGDHIVCMMPMYGGAYTLIKNLEKFNIAVDIVMSGLCKDIMEKVKPNTKLVYLESPSNPTLTLVEIKAITTAVHNLNQGTFVAIDNTFMTPYLQRPLDLGIDVSLHSCTKYLGGHGDILSGSVATNNDEIYKKIYFAQQQKGGVPSPFDCYLLIRSLKTLPMRMNQHMKNGFKVAKFLETHPGVEKVVHPGLPSHPQHQLALEQSSGHSGMVGVYLKGDYNAVCSFMDELKLVRRAASLGADVSLASVPALLSHCFLTKEELETLGITLNYVRLSVGLENPDAIIKDLDQALKKAICYAK